MSQTLFVAVVHDRHADPVIRVFADRGKAIAWAEANFRNCLASPDGYTEYEAEGYVWAASYEYESDEAWVEEVTLDDDSDA